MTALPDTRANDMTPQGVEHASIFLTLPDYGVGYHRRPLLGTSLPRRGQTTFTPTRTTTVNIKLHPSVHKFDPLTDTEKAELEVSIRASEGAMMPILLWREPGKDFDWLMDGLHRYTICTKHNLPFPVIYATGDEADAMAMAKSINNDRRHRTPEQIAFAAARYADATRGKQSGKVPNPPIGGLLNSSPQSTQGTGAKTVSDAAQKFGIPERTVERAKTVLANGTPEVVKAIEDGEISIADAEALSKQPPEAQNQALEDVRTGKAATATKAARKRSQNGRITFDDDKGEAEIGRLQRFFASRNTAFGNSPRYAKITDLLSEVLQVYREWKKDS